MLATNVDVLALRDSVWLRCVAAAHGNSEIAFQHTDRTSRRQHRIDRRRDQPLAHDAVLSSERDDADALRLLVELGADSRLDLVRSRAFEICVALQPLSLDAIV